MGGPGGPRSFSPPLGLLPLSLPQPGGLALALPLRRRPVEVLIDLPLPEEKKPLMFLRASERVVPWCTISWILRHVALCKEQGGVTRGRLSAGYVLSVEPGMPVIQLLLGDLQVAIAAKLPWSGR